MKTIKCQVFEFLIGHIIRFQKILFFRNASGITHTALTEALAMELHYHMKIRIKKPVKLVDS